MKFSTHCGVFAVDVAIPFEPIKMHRSLELHGEMEHAFTAFDKISIIHTNLSSVVIFPLRFGIYNRLTYLHRNRIRRNASNSRYLTQFSWNFSCNGKPMKPTKEVKTERSKKKNAVADLRHSQFE